MNAIEVVGKTRFRVVQKFNAVRGKIKNWAEDEGRREEEKIHSLMQGTDKNKGDGELSEEELTLRESLRIGLAGRL